MPNELFEFRFATAESFMKKIFAEIKLQCGFEECGKVVTYDMFGYHKAWGYCEYNYVFFYYGNRTIYKIGSWQKLGKPDSK